MNNFDFSLLPNVVGTDGVANFRLFRLFAVVRLRGLSFDRKGSHPNLFPPGGSTLWPSTVLTVMLVFVGAVSAAPSTVLFSEDFDVDPADNWTVNTLGSAADANFHFDYSTVGIPSAPNSSGSTWGLRMRASQATTTTAFPSGVSVSPTGQNLVGDYELRFDMWLNFNGPAPQGGSGSTHLTGAGVGTAGTSAQILGTVPDSIYFLSSGEGGSSSDYRAFAPASPLGGYTPLDGVYAAGTHLSARNHTDPYYSVFGGASATAAQLSLFPQQTGATAVGTLGWAWHDVRIVKCGNQVQWLVDGLLLATVDVTAAGALGGDNILFNHCDLNPTPSTDRNAPELLFGLIDNVRVTVIPEPEVAGMLIPGAATLLCCFCRKRRS